MLPGARGEQSDGSNPSHQRRGFDLAEKSLILGHQWCHHLYRRAKRSKPGLLLLGSIICGGQKKVWSFIWYQPSRISLCCLFLKLSQEDLLSQKGQHQWNANLAKSERGDSVRPGVDRLRARRKEKKQNLILPPLLLSNVICCETQWLLSQDVRLFFDDGVFDRYDTIDT